jgi:enamine deaminase RidA (YjgF/YER057c/UK114 family)
MKQPRDPADIHPPLTSYVHQIELSPDERLLVLSGQVGARADSSLPDDPLEQLEVAWDNLDRNLAAAGMDTGDLVKVTFYLVGEWDALRRREVIARRLGGHRPTMTLLYVAALALPTFKVEIDAWASHADAGN